MHPKVKLAPKKIGVQGPSMKKKASPSTSPSPAFTRDEMLELRRLSALLPPSSTCSADPAQLVVRAAGYIQQLVATVEARVSNGTLPREALLHLPPSPIPATSSSNLVSRNTGRTSRKVRRSLEKRR